MPFAKKQPILDLPTNRRWIVPSGEKLKSIREKLELSQTEFARRFGFEIENVRAWEQNKRRPSQAVSMMMAMIDADADSFHELVKAAEFKSRQIKFKSSAVLVKDIKTRSSNLRAEGLSSKDIRSRLGSNVQPKQ